MKAIWGFNFPLASFIKSSSFNENVASGFPPSYCPKFQKSCTINNYTCLTKRTVLCVREQERKILVSNAFSNWSHPKTNKSIRRKSRELQSPCFYTAVVHTPSTINPDCSRGTSILIQHTKDPLLSSSNFILFF